MPEDTRNEVSTNQKHQTLTCWKNHLSEALPWHKRLGYSRAIAISQKPNSKKEWRRDSRNLVKNIYRMSKVPDKSIKCCYNISRKRRISRVIQLLLIRGRWCWLKPKGQWRKYLMQEGLNLYLYPDCSRSTKCKCCKQSRSIKTKTKLKE